MQEVLYHEHSQGTLWHTGERRGRRPLHPHQRFRRFCGDHELRRHHPRHQRARPRGQARQCRARLQGRGRLRARLRLSGRADRPRGQPHRRRQVRGRRPGADAGEERGRRDPPARRQRRLQPQVLGRHPRGRRLRGQPHPQVHLPRRRGGLSRHAEGDGHLHLHR